MRGNKYSLFLAFLGDVRSPENSKLLFIYSPRRPDVVMLKKLSRELRQGKIRMVNENVGVAVIED